MDSKDLRMLSEAYSNIYNNDDFRREDSRADALDYEEKNDALKPSAKIRSTKGVVKISVVKKAETGEYVAKVYINGKYQEGPSYYTDSLEDAIATKKHMLNHYADSGYIIKESANIIPDDVAAKKIAEKIKGTPNLNVPTLKMYVKKYLPMVGKSSTDVDYITALVYDELQSLGLMESNRYEDFSDEAEDEEKAIRNQEISNRMNSDSYNDNLKDAKEYEEEQRKRHNGPYDRGSADSWYRRPQSPHYYIKNQDGTSKRIPEDQMTDEEIEDYYEGYNDNEKEGGHKQYSDNPFESVSSEKTTLIESKKKVNPWAVAKSVAKKKHLGPKEEEKIVKGVKKSAKKYGKKITSKSVKKK